MRKGPRTGRKAIVGSTYIQGKEGDPTTKELTALQNVMPAPKCMQDGSAPVTEPLEKVNLSDDPFTPRLISVSTNLTPQEKEILITILKEFRDIFAWSYEEMPGLDPSLVCHTLNIQPCSRPVVQPRRNFLPDVEVKIKEEVEKLIASGFIKPIKHPTWLANIVPVKKKNGQMRICVDFRDLNKACPKDEFPLPNMDILIDSTSGQGLLSFMDGFSGYNQIKMATRDAEKTAFRTPYGNFYYTVMPFGLKNAGATYQRAMTAVFHDMMGKEVEDYVDDLVVKSKTRETHWEILKKRGIDVDPAKTRAIALSPSPSNKKELKSFLGKLSYIRRFIPGLAALTGAFTPLLKQNEKFVWSSKCEEAYGKVKELVMRLPTMKAPIPSIPLKIYLASTATAIGALLAQEGNPGEEQSICYVSRQLQGAETRYPKTERLCLALVYAEQRLRHYFLAHKLHLMVKTDLVRYLLTKPVLSGCLARWLLQLSEFDITCVTPRAIKGQALIDMLALFPEEETSILSREVPGELPEHSTMVAYENLWTLHFDGSSTTTGGGAGVVLTSPDVESMALSFKLNFPCTNNVAEYEALIMGLSTAQEMGIRNLKVVGDSNLVLSQLNGDFALKEMALAPCRTVAEKLIGAFAQITMERIPGTTNRYADALATLGSKLSFTNEEPSISVIRKDVPTTESQSMTRQFERDDWRRHI
ncbi:hypothetical protein M0R45_009291 [Rubus argutus]|uniref:RNase H type-1 domain-containing protein n=1 Tax=Rubus argutus TaxID=59490 RepID=A0AAW1Y5F1_RUBAR